MSVNVFHNPGRLLMPTVRPNAGASVSPPHSPRLRAMPMKLARNRSHSHSQSLADADLSLLHIPSADIGLQWLGVPLKFDLIEAEVEIEGYQMYAVEKWYFLIFSEVDMTMVTVNLVGLLKGTVL
jgi:hypothetical protein